MITIKKPEEIELMAQAGRIVAGCFGEIEEILKPGVTTRQLDAKVNDYIKANGGIAAFKGYGGYPANICVSINEEVVHGIPGEREISEADLVSVDIGVLKNGYYGDSARSYLLPPGDPEKEKLLEVTRKALDKGIGMARAGNRLSDISFVIQDFVESYGYSVVRELVGHGIGKQMHEDPQIPNFGRPGNGPVLQPGMTLAIEPMVNIGTWKVETLEDKWTIVTKDKQPSAHFEHTIAITVNGPRILTIGN
ncbi:MAG: type I methionyl aminopeptidase [candidate division Zixibacteria bacterium CG_4_9_14_3_um_filter_46_8]|nr:MAG: type I methionyl aminopeptidase [candidate division Zixibacteria bacterium CG_4_9_14_3_um_filter_46_8]